MKHSKGIFRVSLAALVAALFFSIHVGHAEAEPCGKLEFKDGKVSVGVPLPIVLPLADGTVACLQSIAKAASDRPLLRIVTVVAFASDDQRLKQEGKAVAQAMQKVLDDGGLAAKRIRTSHVSQSASGPGRSEGIVLTYKEKSAGPAIAKVVRVEGNATNGMQLQQLAKTDSGTNLRKLEYLKNETNTRTIARVGDSDQLRIEPSTLLQFRNATLNSNYKRVAEIKVIKGTAKSIVAHQDGGSFRVVTDSAETSVKGTTFRTTVTDDGTTRIEVEDGQVELGNDQSRINIGAGYGSRVKPGGAPEEPRRLLSRAAGMRPLRGSSPTPPALSWQPVEGADGGYLVDIAGNAEFTKQITRITVAAGVTTVTPDANLAEQKWFWRIHAVDADGFVGMPSKIFTFDVKPAEPEPDAAASGS